MAAPRKVKSFSKNPDAPPTLLGVVIRKVRVVRNTGMAAAFPIAESHGDQERIAIKPPIVSSITPMHSDAAWIPKARTNQKRKRAVFHPRLNAFCFFRSPFEGAKEEEEEDQRIAQRELADDEQTPFCACLPGGAGLGCPSRTEVASAKLLFSGILVS